MTEDDTGHGRYLFAIARGLRSEELGDVSALDGAPVEVVEHAGLQAVVCTVDLARFGAEALARNLEDLAWLERVARTHNEVVFRTAGCATTAPARLVTIYEDDDSVRARLEESQRELAAALDAVEGRVELSVKAFAVPGHEGGQPAEGALPTSGEGVDAGAPGAGAAYLLGKKKQAERRRDAGALAARRASEVDAALSAAAVASRRLAPQDPRLTGRREPMVLNASYLIPRDEVDRFRAVVDGLDVDGVLIECEGPWPPYSFATLEAP